MLVRNTLIALCWLALTAGASAQTTVVTPDAIKVATMGSAWMLTGANGMTLYIETNDTDGKSMCNGACATNWPPLGPAAGAASLGFFTIITRDDGTKQWAYRGMPLYYWKNDKKPGDTTGEGVAGRWHVAAP